ncbi:MAG: FkbM family methyltransferase [Nitrospirae bacterium]|nr:FkbM family methyltransferase [Candidatus Troglogloeales bacterium]
MYLLFKKIIKAVRLAPVTLYRRALRHVVAAAIEHERLLVALDCQTVVDIGANRGQFSLVARHCFPKARIVSFEPLPGPASIFRRVFSDDDQVLLHQTAIGPRSEVRTIHVSQRDDSSSLLPISSVQTAMFPGTGEISTTEVRVAPLEELITADDLRAPALLKLDVQGFEHEALIGCESLLSHFDMVYCECSFVELYSGQKLAWEIIDWLSARGFGLVGIFNTTYQHGQAVQADFLFGRKGGRCLVEKELP